MNWYAQDGLVQTAAPTVEPVSRDLAKKHLRISHGADDDVIDVYIKAAREQGEVLAKKQFINATWKLTCGNFPGGIEPLELRMPPISSVTSVVYKDTANTTQTWSASKYQVDAASIPGRIIPVYGEVWPVVYPNTYDAVQVTFVAGYGATAASVPGKFVQGILMLVAHYYEHRPGVDEVKLVEVPFGIKALFYAGAFAEVY